MSEKLHEHEFLLLLLDLADGAPIRSEEYTNIEQTQEKFLINEENFNNIRYTIRKSDVIGKPKSSKHPKNPSWLGEHMMEQSEHRMWPFDGEENE